MPDFSEGKGAPLENGLNTTAHTQISVSHEDPDAHHVDIAQAEQEFNELSRQLTIRSEVVQSLTDSTATAHDVEKGAALEQQERFDLREYLTSSNDANQEAGIKHKVRVLFALKTATPPLTETRRMLELFGMICK
jgi:hypothetical protein